MHIHELITPKRVTPSLPASSKQRLLEKLSELLSEDRPDLDENVVFQSLLESERRGSTGIGAGVALPHGRLKGLKQAVGAFATLAADMDYDSIDHKPVKMAFALLVPEDAPDEHLKLLSQLAGLFRSPELRERLLQAKSPEELYNCLVDQHTH